MINNFSNLRDKTIFDFCKDKNILSKITGFPDPLKSIDYIKGFSSLVQAQLIQKLALEINNYELLKASTKLEEDLWKEFDKENQKAIKKGYIIGC